MTNGRPYLIIPPVKDRSTPKRTNRGRPGAWWLLLILLLALGLRLYRLDDQSLWNDEGTSVALAQRDARTIARDAGEDIHPPLYYWILGGWVRLVGTEEAAVRSLSAMLAVILVSLIYTLGSHSAGRGVGLAAALFASVHPFQIYYAQETRMYMLLAVVTAGAMLALFHLVGRSNAGLFGPAMALILLETAGLYTHYSFLFMVIAINLSCGLFFTLSWRKRRVPWRILAWWTLTQVCVLLLYLPWLPIAAQRVTAWPNPAQSAATLPALMDTWRWLVFGPTIATTRAAVPLIAAALIVAIGLLFTGKGRHAFPARRQWLAGTLLLWLCMPIVLMVALNLYREAYLKFLLVATPPVVILMAGGSLGAPYIPRSDSTEDRPLEEPRTALGKARGAHSAPISPSVKASRVSLLGRLALRLVQFLALVSILVAFGMALRNLYVDPAYARDNYRDIAAYVTAVGRVGDAILLNAPGQQEVFDYYYDRMGGDIPTYPLPQSRPLIPQSTEDVLAELARPGHRVFAVLWATDESDPDRFIEGWLDSHAYKALDSWYGNVRLAVYAIPEETPSAPDHTLDIELQDPLTGDAVTLLGYSQPEEQLAAGDIGQFTLFWLVHSTPTQRYKVFLHVLDAENHIIAQRDAEPGGGARLTTLWTPGETIADNYGIPIHPGTPPGHYRVEIGLYSLETGRRLLAPDGSSLIWLHPLRVDRPLTAVPVPALGMQHSADAAFGELTLLGYDVHKLGFAHQPDAVPQPGDILQIVLYWRAESSPSRAWQIAIDLVGSGEQVWARIVAEPVVDYPTTWWQAGDVWRGHFLLGIPEAVPAGAYRLRIRAMASDETSTAGEYLSELFSIRR